MIFFQLSPRFWLARAVESYLRGNTSYCDQIFLMRRDLLQVSYVPECYKFNIFVSPNSCDIQECCHQNELFS